MVFKVGFTTILMLWILIFIFTAYKVDAQASLECFPCHCYTEGSNISADCSSRNLSSVPAILPRNISSLNLALNTLEEFHNGLKIYEHLKHLNASFNSISVLHVDDFTSLSGLEVLDLQGNHLQLSEDAYPQGVFRDQKQLRVLLIHNNTDSYEPSSYPGETLKDIISLQSLYMDGLKNPIFGAGFKKLEYLVYLKLTGNCEIRTLDNSTFSNTPFLKYLDLSNCALTQIEALTFAPLQQIIELDVSYNPDLGIPGLGTGLYGLQHSTLQVLMANRLHRMRGTGLLLRHRDIQYLENITSLREMYLDTNRLEIVEPRVISILPKSVHLVSGRENNFLFGLYILATSGVTGLKYLDASGQGQSTASPFALSRDYSEVNLDSVGGCTCEESCPLLLSDTVPEELKDLSKHKPWPGNFTIGVPPNAIHGNFSSSQISTPVYRMAFGPNKLKILDLSYNFFTRWEGPVLGLHSLEFVDLSHNFCDYISDDFMIDLPSLKVVNFSYNFLGYSLNNNSLRYSSSLEHMDLSNNKIFHLQEKLFHNMTHLKHLDVSFNYLKSWKTNIHQCVNLTILDISNNIFAEVPKFLREEIDLLSKGFPHIRMSNNPLVCNCKTLDSLTWMKKKSTIFVDLEKINCTDMDDNLQSFDQLGNIILALDKKCKSYVGVMVGILCLAMFVLSLSLSGVVYRYRWKLRYLYYLARNRYRGYLPPETEQNQFEFDAFVSYADEDRTFVVRDMRQRLEDEDGLRLCIHHRDFLAGEAIAANILNAVRSSKRTVAILSRNFLRSHWCRYEVEMAKVESVYTGRNALLILVFEEVPVRELPVDIAEVMRSDCYIEYTRDAEGQEVFWSNLKRALRS